MRLCVGGMTHFLAQESARDSGRAKPQGRRLDYRPPDSFIISVLWLPYEAPGWPLRRVLRWRRPLPRGTRTAPARRSAGRLIGVYGGTMGRRDLWRRENRRKVTRGPNWSREFFSELHFRIREGRTFWFLFIRRKNLVPNVNRWSTRQIIASGSNVIVGRKGPSSPAKTRLADWFGLVSYTFFGKINESRESRVAKVRKAGAVVEIILTLCRTLTLLANKQIINNVLQSWNYEMIYWHVTGPSLTPHLWNVYAAVIFGNFDQFILIGVRGADPGADG